MAKPGGARFDACAEAACSSSLHGNIITNALPSIAANASRSMIWFGPFARGSEYP